MVAAVLIVGGAIMPAFLYDVLLGHMPEAVAHGLQILLYGLLIFIAQGIMARVFRGRGGQDEPFPFVKSAALAVSIIIVIEVIRALI